MWIMISGPYRSGTRTQAERDANLLDMNLAAHAVFLRGHIPVIGVNMALPIIHAVGEQHYDAIMMPVSLALVERCDAVLRIGGPSSGADEEAAKFLASGKPVFRSLESISRD